MGIMTRIATATVATGTAVMIVSVAVIAGFREQITDNLTGFGAHVQIIDRYNANMLETRPVERNAVVEAGLSALPECRLLYPFAVRGGILKTGDAIEGVMLKGVDGTFDWSFFNRHMIRGQAPHTGGPERTKDILISATVADALALDVDDRVEMLFVRENLPPRRDRFRICGVYGTGFDELDRAVVMTDMRNVQRLNGWDSLQVTGYEAMATADGKMAELRDRARRVISENEEAGGQPLTAVDIRGRFPGLFDWLEAHNINAAVIITIMLLVSLLNMISALLIILLERTRMIGVLKALGMDNLAVQRIFIYRSAFIVLRGMLWGNLVGLSLCVVQLAWHPFKLDRAGYFLTEVPVALHWGWWTALNAGSFAVVVALLAVPVMIVSRFKPDITLRFR